MGKCRQKSIWLFLHSVMMLPGDSKILLSRAMPEIAREISSEESLDAMSIYAIVNPFSD
jgi:hypothetical protein